MSHSSNTPMGNFYVKFADLSEKYVYKYSKYRIEF